MNEKIKTKLADIESDDSGLTLEERFDSLGQTIITNAYDILEREANGQKIDADEEELQLHMVKQFNIISGVYMKLRQNKRITGRVNEKFDEQLLQKIRQKKSSIGSIVVDMSKTGTHG